MSKLQEKLISSNRTIKKKSCSQDKLSVLLRASIDQLARNKTSQIKFETLQVKKNEHKLKKSTQMRSSMDKINVIKKLSNSPQKKQPGSSFEKGKDFKQTSADKQALIKSTIEKKLKDQIKKSTSAPEFTEEFKSPKKLKKSESTTLNLIIVDENITESLVSQIKDTLNNINSLSTINVDEISHENLKIEGKKIVNDLLHFQSEYANLFKKINEQNLELMKNYSEYYKKYRTQIKKSDRLKMGFQGIVVKIEKDNLINKNEIERLKEEILFTSRNTKLMKKVLRLNYTQEEVDEAKKAITEQNEKEQEFLKKIYAKISANEKLMGKAKEIRKRSTIRLSEIRRENMKNSDDNKYLRFNSLIPDPIDDSLLRFLAKFYSENNIMIIPFVKKGEGVYAFGSQTISIKLENNDKIMVKSGNSICDITKFIELNSYREEFKNKKNSSQSRIKI